MTDDDTGDEKAHDSISYLGKGNKDDRKNLGNIEREQRSDSASHGDGKGGDGGGRGGGSGGRGGASHERNHGGGD